LEERNLVLGKWGEVFVFVVVFEVVAAAAAVLMVRMIFVTLRHLVIPLLIPATVAILVTATTPASVMAAISPASTASAAYAIAEAAQNAPAPRPVNPPRCDYCW
jgi:hypothetical protein